MYFYCSYRKLNQTKWFAFFSFWRKWCVWNNPNDKYKNNEENKAGYSEFVLCTGLHHCFTEFCGFNPFFVFCYTGCIISEIMFFKENSGMKCCIHNILKFKLLVILHRKMSQCLGWDWVKLFPVLQCQTMYPCLYPYLRGYILLWEIIIIITKFCKFICLYVWYKLKEKWYQKSQLFWQTLAMR